MKKIKKGCKVKIGVGRIKSTKWGEVVLCLAIIGAALSLSFYFKNGRWMWLLGLLFYVNERERK